MSGYGRGGRGAALLQALESQSRRPGQDAALEAPAGASAPVVAAAAAAPPTRTPLGRGALMQLLAAQQKSQNGSPPRPAEVKAEQPASVPAPAPFMPMGRGLGRGLLARPVPPTAPSPMSSQPASPQRPAVAAEQTAAAPPRPMGRGLGLLQARSMGAAPGVTASHTPPAPTRTSPPNKSPPSSVAPTPTPTPTPPGAQSRSPQPDTTEKPSSWIQRGLDRLEIKDEVVQKEQGTSGRPIAITANYIAIQTRDNAGIYQYAVKFNPPLDSLLIRKRLVRELEDLPKPFEFDGATMFMPIRLPGEKYEGTASSREGQQYRITIQLVRVVPYASMTQFFNVMFNRIMTTLKYYFIQRMHYDPHKATDMPQYKMEVWPGYVSSIKEYDGGLMCLLDTTHKVLRTDTVLDVMQDTIQRDRNNFKDAIMRDIIGFSVLTRYNNRTWRIDDVDYTQNPLSTFETRNGPVSYVDYFREHHGKTIHDLQQPLLIHKPTEREKRESRGKPLEVVCLIPELCYMTGLSDKARADFRLMKDLATHTRITPAQRQQRLRQFTENVNSHPEARQILSSWGLRLANDGLTTKGRQLEPETIFLGGNSSVSAGEKADWGSAFNRNTVREPVDLRNWIVVCTQRNQQDVGHFVSCLESCYKSLGVNINKPNFITIQNDRTDTYLNAIRSNLSEHVQLVMTIFPTSRDDRYNAIKKFCYIENPVASQVINSRTICKRDKVRSVAQKVALQMNCKLGGGLWSVRIPLDGLMIVGIDTFHETTKGKNSWGGFVASLNRDCTSWYSRVSRQMPGQEMSDGLSICMLSALAEYAKRNGTPPSRIIIFRDGVGDGDLKTVREHEVAQFAATFAKFGENYQPRLSCIVVQKRVNTKLYMRRGNNVDNAPPGTILDHSVTRRELVDFYLVSQFVRQGTVTPTHYVVVHDESGWKIDNLQKLAYKMTHMYYNWPGTIRSPAPCQYAHKLAFMVGQSLHNDPDHRLCTRLFFL